MINVAIVGGGPNGMYLLNGILSLSRTYKNKKISVTIFDKYGEFGSGWAHSPNQPKTSMLNRIVGQLSYGPDKTNDFCNIFPSTIEMTFDEWCQKKYEQTGIERYQKQPDEFPTRELYGESLAEIFQVIVSRLKEEGVNVAQVIDEVNDIEKNKMGQYWIHGKNTTSHGAFDAVILATGHQESKDHFGISSQLKQHIEYYNYAYPLFDIPNWQEKQIGVIGMGLTAIDTLLYYTENKGGQFIRENGDLRYIPSGNEPRKLYALSRSGYFTYSRPHNHKEVDLEKYEHKGYFYSRQLVDKMRANLGSLSHPDNSPENHLRQLNFDQHVFPVLILELQLCYYRILFGQDILERMLEQSRPLIDKFITRNNQYNLDKDIAIQFLTSAVERIARSTVFKLRKYLSELVDETVEGVSIQTIAKRFIHVVYGAEVVEGKPIETVVKGLNQCRSPWGHSSEPEDHLFNWGTIVSPILHMDFSPTTTYREKLLQFMEVDRLQSEQGNLDNPYKGACDDVFRDLRQDVVYAIDFGGITPTSYSKMLKDFYAVHNRAANGNCIELMEKVEALIKADIVDVTFAKSNIQVSEGKVYLHSLSDPGQYTLVDTMIDAKLHNFNVKNAKNPLFKNLVDKGIASYWVHKDQFGVQSESSGLDITKEFQIVNKEGQKEFIFCIGQPSEGIMFFQNGSIRPNVNHHVANDMLSCLNAIKRDLFDDAFNKIA